LGSEPQGLATEQNRNKCVLLTADAVDMLKEEKRRKFAFFAKKPAA
jgi:hypothetical protein